MAFSRADRHKRSSNSIQSHNTSVLRIQKAIFTVPFDRVQGNKSRDHHFEIDKMRSHFRVILKMVHNRWTNCCLLQAEARDNRKVKFTVQLHPARYRYPPHLTETKTTGYAAISKYSEMSEFGQFPFMQSAPDPDGYALQIEVEWEVIESECDDIRKGHEEKLKAVYKMGKHSGDVLLIPARREDRDNERQEEKEEELSTIGNEDEADEMRGIRMSSLMLRSSSEVFSRMLSNPMKEQKEKIIEIDTESLQVVDDLVYFLTTGSLRTQRNVLKLLELSHLYRIAPLNYACLQTLADSVKSCTLISTMKAFDRLSYDDEVAMRIYQKLVDKVVADRTRLMQGISDQTTIPKCWRALIGMADGMKK